jgi:hypothetical protein
VSSSDQPVGGLFIERPFKIKQMERASSVLKSILPHENSEAANSRAHASFTTLEGLQPMVDRAPADRGKAGRIRFRSPYSLALCLAFRPPSAD